SRQGRSRLRPSSADFVGWRVILISFLGGAVGTSIGTVAFFYALQAGGVVLTVPVLATNILWSAIIAALFLKERLTAQMVVGIVAAVSGVALLGYGRSAGNEVLPGALAAIPLALVTALSWATAANCTRYALTRGVDKYLAIALSQTCGLVLLVGILFAVGRGALLWTTALSAIGLFLLAGLLSAVALICDTHALSLTTVASVLTISGTNPVISTILAVVFLGEDLRPLMAIGTFLTVVGVLYVQLSKGETEEIY
ncbi:MAG: DMT family transporter, partial [Anaerolineae bacterium]